MPAKLTIQSMIVGGTGVSFDAYLTDMSQTFDSTWNQTEVFGRNDPIATFANTKRSISLSFEAPAADLEQAKGNMENIGKLVRYMYPGYNVSRAETGKTIGTGKKAKPETAVTGKYVARPPLVKIKFANLIQSYKGGGLLGFIDSLSTNPVLEAGMFEAGGKLYPRTVTISFGFTVLHQTDVGWEVNESGKLSWMAKKIPFM